MQKGKLSRHSHISEQNRHGGLETIYFLQSALNRDTQNFPLLLHYFFGIEKEDIRLLTFWTLSIVLFLFKSTFRRLDSSSSGKILLKDQLNRFDPTDDDG
jgi:hypothetical protein